MKKILSLCVVMIVSLWAVSAFSQTMYWEITEHSTDLDILREEISEYIESGLVPVGISYDNMQLHVLYIEAPDLGVDGWYIEWYDTPNGLQNGITDMMNEGYMASGITYTGDLFYVLYIYLDHGATAWQLVPSAKNLNAVQNAIQPYVNQSYLPVGITSLGREYWTLLVQIPETTVQSWLIESYAANSQVLTRNIDGNIAQGYVPWGFMYRDNEVHILYWGF